MNQLWKYRLLYLAGILALFGLDQGTKYWAVKNLGATGSTITIIPRYLELKLIYNTGAAWGMFSGWTQGLAVMSTIMIIVILTVLGRTSLKDRLLGWALSFQLGGAFGNLADRLTHHNGVVDFIHGLIPLGGGINGIWYKLFEWIHFIPGQDFAAGKIPAVYDWPVFNCADMSVVIGTFLLLIYIIKMPPEKQVRKDISQPATWGIQPDSGTSNTQVQGLVEPSTSIGVSASPVIEETGSAQEEKTREIDAPPGG